MEMRVVYSYHSHHSIDQSDMNIARLEVARMVMNTKFRKLHGADGKKMHAVSGRTSSTQYI
jgi:hypothetical protein